MFILRTMRTNGVCVWFLLNIMLMGMMGYMYLLWMQYWKYARSTTAARQNLYQPENSVFHFDEEDTIQIRQGRPRIRPRNLDITHESGFLFPMYDAAPETKETKPPPTTTITPATLSPEEEKRLIEKHKGLLTVQLRSSQMDGGNILFKHENKYGVKYRGLKEKGIPTKAKLLCALQKANVRTLRDGDEPFTTEGMAKYFPHDEVLEGNQFNTCAVVSSAGSLRDSNLGKFIDVHDFIVRFNHAPTKRMEKDVGFKTHFRILNSQILTKPKFDFWGSPLYRNVSMLVWDPSNYSASLAEWYSAPDFPVFPEYFRRRLMIPHESLHFLHPASLWRIWDVLQMFTHTRVQPNPPSSGFLGLVLMLRHCKWVDMFEFIPSIRFSKQCHYWEAKSSDPGCTFGDWHPLSTEKLLTLLMNVADDTNTYVKGYVTIPGFSQISCPKDTRKSG